MQRSQENQVLSSESNHFGPGEGIWFSHDETLLPIVFKDYEDCQPEYIVAEGWCPNVSSKRAALSTSMTLEAPLVSVIPKCR